jgi:hypothetical protein
VAFFYVNKGLYAHCGLSRSSCSQILWGYQSKIELGKKTWLGVRLESLRIKGLRASSTAQPQIVSLQMAEAFIYLYSTNLIQ